MDIITNKLNINDDYEDDDSFQYLNVVYPCSFFLEFTYAVSRVTDYIEIWRLEFSSKEFSQLIKASKQSKELRFIECRILTDSEINFGQMEESNIHKITMEGYYRSYEHLYQYEDSIIKIFLAILHCPYLMRSLKEFRFECNYDFKKELLVKAKEVLGDKYRDIIPTLSTYDW